MVLLHTWLYYRPRQSENRESATGYARDYHPWLSSAFASANRSPPSRNAPGLEKKQEITTPASPPLLEKSRGVRCEPGECILLGRIMIICCCR